MRHPPDRHIPDRHTPDARRPRHARPALLALALALTAAPALAQSDTVTVDPSTIPGTPAQTAAEVDARTGAASDPTATDGDAPAVREFVPVLVGGDATANACAGMVRAGDTADVRRGPLEEYGKIDELEAGRTAHACVEEGGYVGIVYGDEGLDCGVATAIPQAVAYDGPCRVGWVRADALETTGS